jgi:hypothetical protein
MRGEEIFDDSQAGAYFILIEKQTSEAAMDGETSGVLCQLVHRWPKNVLVVQGIDPLDEMSRIG